MTTAELNDFVEQGYLDSSVTEAYDPYYEPALTGGAYWDDGNAVEEIAAYNDIRSTW